MQREKVCKSATYIKGEERQEWNYLVVLCLMVCTH